MATEPRGYDCAWSKRTGDQCPLIDFHHPALKGLVWAERILFLIMVFTLITSKGGTIRPSHDFWGNWLLFVGVISTGLLFLVSLAKIGCAAWWGLQTQIAALRLEVQQLKSVLQPPQPPVIPLATGARDSATLRPKKKPVTKSLPREDDSN